VTLAELCAAGIELSLAGDELVVRHKVPLTGEQLEFLRGHKQQLIAAISGRVCQRCRHWWQHASNASTGDCLLHHFETSPAEDCAGWSRCEPTTAR
jgi:hypothetical protein